MNYLLSQMKLQFVTIVGVAIGYGHLGRCIALANYAKGVNVSSAFLLYGDIHAQRWAEQLGHACEVRPLSALTEVNALVTRCSQEVSVNAIVADIVHPLVTGNAEILQQLFQQLGLRSKTIAVFDTIGDGALSLNMPDLPVQFVIAPYVGATAVPGAPWRTLAGAEYAVLDSAYTNMPPRLVRQEANRVLVTCGGSDPMRLTDRVLRGLNRINKALSIRVIIGPLFDPELITTIKAVADNSHHEIVLIHAPKSIADHISWCDLAVAASGLTKYELAACATPSVLMSIDTIHDEVNRPFVSSSGMWDLGVEPSIQSIEHAVANLLADYVTRSKMAEAGLRLVDGKGPQRIISNIMRMSNAAN